MAKIYCIVKLTNGIIPDYVEIRSQISENIITINVDEENLERLQNDIHVEYVELPKKLKLID